jgi:hypothetical protein
VEEHQVRGGVVRVWDDVLTPAECSRIIEERFEGYAPRQEILEQPRFAEMLLEQVKGRAPGFPDMRPTGHVTYTLGKRGIGWHFDGPRGASHKLVIYLNEVPSGGTLFGRSTESVRVRVENKVGRVVLFDIGLEHASESFSDRYTKYAVGLRLRA